MCHARAGAPLGWAPEDCRRPGVHGNPFEMDGREELRDPVCAAHREALETALGGAEPDLWAIAARHGCPVPRRGWDGAAAARRVRELWTMLRSPGARPLGLICACAPRRCHCEAIRDVLLRD